jgi:lipopolysaccharide export system permease protein
MGVLGRYVFRTTIVAFSISVTTLTILVWFTQVIREFDIVTNQRQSVLTFLSITSLFIPMLVMMIASIAFVISAAHVLNKLSSDSEIIVMSAAGLSPWRALKPLLAAAFVVSLLVALLAVYLSPLCLRELRDRLTEVRTDILTHIAQPGRFTSIGGGLTFHIAGRQPDGILLGIFIDDRRDPKEHITILAQNGEVIKKANGAFLLLQGGSVQTIESGQTDPRIVTFQRYAFDLSNFAGGPQNINYSAHEKSFWDILSPPADPQQQGEYRAELHERLAAPLYPLVFAVLAYVFLGPPQTTRQSRALAVVGMIVAVTIVRLAGFLSIIVGVRVPSALAVQYVVIAGALAGGLWQISRGTTMEPAPIMTKLAAAITKWTAAPA